MIQYSSCGDGSTYSKLMLLYCNNQTTMYVANNLVFHDCALNTLKLTVILPHIWC